MGRTNQKKTELIKKLKKNNIVKKGIFVYLYKTSKYFYVYDVVSSEIMKISEFIYKLLKALNERKINSRLSSLYDLSQKVPVEKILNGLSKIHDIRKNDSVFDSIPKNFQIVLNGNGLQKILALECLILEVTQNCNFRCTYCTYSGNYKFERKHKNINMTIDTAKKATDYFFKNRDMNSESHWISFFGGEPLLNKDLIMETIKYAKKKFSNISFNIQTNGYLLDYEFYNKIKDYPVTLSISIYGPQYLHDRCRILKDGKGTFDKVISNLKKIAENNKNYLKDKVTIAYTLPSLNFLTETSNFHYNHPVLKNCKIIFYTVNDFNLKPEVSVPKICNVSPEEIHTTPDLKDFFKNYIKALKNDSAENLYFENQMFGEAIKKINNRLPLESIVTPRGFCKIGMKRIFVDPLENLHICERSTRMPIIGDLTGGIDWSIVNQMEQNYIQTCEPCHECWAIMQCNMCWTKLYSRYKNKIDVKFKEIFCDEIRKMAAFNLEVFSIINEVIPEIIPDFQ